MNDYMKTRFVDGVVADVLCFSVEDLCMGIKDEKPKDCVGKRIKHVYIFSPAPRKQIILGADRISTTTQLIPGQPTYRYSVMCSNGSKRVEVIWYDNAPPVYAGIYDVFQKMAEQIEFNRYAEEWN